jgi:hypothetical protein
MAMGMIILKYTLVGIIVTISLVLLKLSKDYIEETDEDDENL